MCAEDFDNFYIYFKAIGEFTESTSKLFHQFQTAAETEAISKLSQTLLEHPLLLAQSTEPISTACVDINGVC